jgi:type IV pilus assembly protein PilB
VQALTPAAAESRPGRLIGDVVVDLGFATREKVEEAVELARAQRKPTGQVLVEQGILRHDQLARVVAERYGLDYIDLSVYELDMGAVNLLEMEAIRRYQAVPVGFLEDGTLLLAMADPTNVLTVDDVAMLTGRKVRADAAECALIRDLATDPRKRELFTRLAEHLSILATEVEAAIAAGLGGKEGT